MESSHVKFPDISYCKVKPLVLEAPLILRKTKIIPKFYNFPNFVLHNELIEPLRKVRSVSKTSKLKPKISSSLSTSVNSSLTIAKKNLINKEIPGLFNIESLKEKLIKSSVSRSNVKSYYIRSSLSRSPIENSLRNSIPLNKLLKHQNLWSYQLEKQRIPTNK